MTRPAFLVTLAVAGSLGMVAPAASDAPAVDHLDCSASYQALTLALPYLPGILLMPNIARRSGHARRVYFEEANPISRPAVRREAERRAAVLDAAFDAGEITLDMLVEQAHRCDAAYGLDPTPVSLHDLQRTP